MLKFDKQVRFTELEIYEASRFGIDLAGVKSKEQFSEALIKLIEILERERPALLEQIAKALAEETGRRLPVKLRIVR